MRPPFNLLLLLPLLTFFAPFTSATDAFPNTDDHATTIAIPRWFYWGKTASEITTLINQKKARITKLRVLDPTVPTFAVSMVQNTDSYASGWWWYFGVDDNGLGSLLTGRRLISLDPYWTSSGLRFAAVMVPNQGVQNRAWWWYWGQTAAQVGALLAQNNARPVELRPYNDGGEKFAVVMVSNTGIDYKEWWWWVDVTADFIGGKLVSDHVRVACLAPSISGNGLWVTVLIENEGEGWYWWLGITPDQVLTNIGNHNTRLIDISPFKSGNNWVYTAVELEDNNYPQSPINSLSKTVHTHAEQNGWAGGFHGSYFVESTSSPNPLVADNSYFRYEPASSIKVLYLLYTLRSGVSLSSPITYYWPDDSHPNPNVCPQDYAETAATAHQTSILNALTWMIQESNNVMTRAFAIRWGTGPVQDMARSLGMVNTNLAQAYIGCGFRGGVRNTLTLQDAALLYSCVNRGTCLFDTAARKTFFDILVGGSPTGNAIGQVVNQEAAKLGKSSAVVSQFLSKFNVRWKGGSYTFCLSNSNCNPFKVDYAVTGWMSVPFKPSPRSFLFGNFVNDLMINCPGGQNGCAALVHAQNENLPNAAEAARETINQALATW